MVIPALLPLVVGHFHAASPGHTSPLRWTGLERCHTHTLSWALVECTHSYSIPWAMDRAGHSPPPTPTPVPGRLNVPDLYWSTVTALVYEIPEIVVRYEAPIRAVGRAAGHAPVPGWVLEGVGFIASVGPNVVEHLQKGEGISSPELWTDVIVDAGGWALTLGTAPLGTATFSLGAGALAGPQAAPIGAGVGFLAGSVGVSAVYDLWIAPAVVRPWVRTWFKP